MELFPVLPSQFSLKYEEKFLRCQTEFNRINGLLKFEDGELRCEKSKDVFQVENAKTWDGLVHIKSLYNNKYLARWNPDDGYIGASSNAPDEDKGSWTCTLFRPELVLPSAPEEEGKSEIMKIRLYHIHTEHTTDKSSLVGIVKDDLQPYINCLTIESGHEGYDFTVIARTWPPVPQWLRPRIVAFRILYSNIYLIASPYKGRKYIAFSDDSVVVPEFILKVAHQMFPTPEGVIYIKSLYHGQFWKSDGFLIRAEVDDLPCHGDDKTAAMFRVVLEDPDDQNVIGLLNMNSTNCCKGILYDGHYFLGDGLMSPDPGHDYFVQLEVIDIEYLMKKLDDASRPPEFGVMFPNNVPLHVSMSKVIVGDFRNALLKNIKTPEEIGPLKENEFVALTKELNKDKIATKSNGDVDAAGAAVTPNGKQSNGDVDAVGATVTLTPNGKQSNGDVDAAGATVTLTPNGKQSNGDVDAAVAVVTPNGKQSNGNVDAAGAAVTPNGKQSNGDVDAAGAAVTPDGGDNADANVTENEKSSVTS